MILITGATGNTGPEIVKAVLSRGERVRVLARSPEIAVRLLGEDVEIARGDLADPQSIEAAMEEVDRAFLASAPAPDTFKNLRRVTRAMLYPPMGFVVRLETSIASVSGYAARDKLCADIATLQAGA